MSVSNEERKLLIKQKAHQRRKRRFILITAAVVIIAAAIVVGGYFFLTYRTYADYDVSAELELNGAADNLSFEKFGCGYIKCDANSISYFDKAGVIWEEDFEMSRPVLDVCGDYAAVADMKQSEVYIFDKHGLVSKVNTAHDILDVEVSRSGRIALSTNDGDSNFIELKDKAGNELINVKSVFASSGYLSDITLSDDGSRLAAAFIGVPQGSVRSKVLFYNFANNSTDEMLVGEFDQYDDTVLTTVSFMENNVVAAIGDDSFTFYNFSGAPEIIYEELGHGHEFQSMAINEKYLMFIMQDDTGENNYRMLAYSSAGRLIGDVGFDFAYNKAVISGRNAVLYAGNAFQMISFGGVRRCSITMPERITYILPSGFPGHMLLATPGNVSLIRLK